MFVQDKIADMLTRIRNANIMRYKEVEVIGTKMTLGIAEILKREGYIEDFKYEKSPQGDKLTLTLKYGSKKEQFQQVCLISKFRQNMSKKEELLFRESFL